MPWKMRSVSADRNGRGFSSVSAFSKRDAHHRRERERDKGGNRHGHAERDGEFAEEPADDAGHEEQGNEDGDQREAERNDGEADLLRALERRLQRFFARFDDSGRCFRSSRWRRPPRSRWQMVSAMSERLSRLKPMSFMTPKVPMMASGSATLGMTVAQNFRRKTKMTMTTSATVSSSVNCTSAIGGADGRRCGRSGCRR